MTDKFTYTEIEQAYGSAVQLGMMKCPSKTAYKLSKLINKLRVETTTIQKGRIELYKKYGSETKPGNGEYKIPDDEMTKFKGIVDVFMEQAMEIEYHPISCDQFQEIPAMAIVGMGRFMQEKELIVEPR